MHREGYNAIPFHHVYVKFAPAMTHKTSNASGGLGTAISARYRI